MAHIHERIDFTVEVFIVHKDKVLLRKHDKYGIWLSVGGHIELNEDPNQAAVREVKEEVGLDVALHDARAFRGTAEGFTELIPPQSLNRHRISETHEHVCLVYFAKAETDRVIPEHSHDEWRWCTKKEVPALGGIQENVVFWACRALETLGK